MGLGDDMNWFNSLIGARNCFCEKGYEPVRLINLFADFLAASFSNSILSNYLILKN
jgi:hypothetical protein